MTVNFESHIDVSGRELAVEIEASGRCESYVYGSDADGNRGEVRWDVEDVSIIIYDLRGNDITDKVKARYKKEYDVLMGYAEQYIMLEDQ